ncbi:hypothetical protein LCGC14_0246310 [marine sediment metagenome]|uniref:Uncharacterized protein n=1 Tax=marine sediment metagenome TaxID=412755 RepID=A0A0F9U692_9ZZZZ
MGEITKNWNSSTPAKKGEKEEVKEVVKQETKKVNKKAYTTGMCNTCRSWKKFNLYQGDCSDSEQVHGKQTNIGNYCRNHDNG